MINLRKGDTSSNGQITIVDEDRLCYIVKSVSKGAVGLRTISKKLLREFVTFISQHPEIPVNEVRYKISGTSDIDKYEYGYGATLGVMAKMVLGQESISNNNAEGEQLRGSLPLQQIFYGAPGTGKSHEVKKSTDTAEKDGRVFRATFHPDSDYSTFVGCYKPTTKNISKQPLLDYDSLVDRFKKYIQDIGNITHASAAIGYNYHDSIVRMQERGVHTITDLLADAHKSGTTYDTTIRSGMLLYEEQVKQGMSSNKISYKFVPQAFTNAYIKAWNTKEDVYLIIEEINRGNCAQIFGDLFQLLDRGNDGRSDYPIDADSDLANYIGKELAGSTRDDFPEGVKEGKKLVLPSNLYIWATMNTSDQSLFPIDSAFKRRWDWKYMKIRNHPEENYKIKLSDKEYDWWEFIQRINEIIASMTSSADKQLGYFFCKATEGNNISPETFVSKVIFYLWNDVFKDYGFEDESLFSYKEVVDGKEETKELTFPDFYDEDGEKVNEVRLKGFLDSVMNWKKDGNKNND